MQRVVVVVRCVEEVHTDDNMGAVGACVQCAEEGAGEDTYTAHFLRQLQEANGGEQLGTAGEPGPGQYNQISTRIGGSMLGDAIRLAADGPTRRR